MASDSQHLRGCWARFAIDLHPSRSADVLQGVRDQLQSMLLRYNNELQGVLLAYSKERILNSEARVHPYFPYFHVEVIALVYLFRPTVGALIGGVVNIVGQDYIGLLVLGIFNASIGRKNIPPHWRSAPLDNCWVSNKNARQRIEIGSVIQFAVQRIRHEGGFFTLTGSLNGPEVSLDTAISQPLEPSPDQSLAAATKRAAKRQRQARLPVTEPNTAHTLEPQGTSLLQQAAAVDSPISVQQNPCAAGRKRKRHQADSSVAIASLPASDEATAKAQVDSAPGSAESGLQAAASDKLAKKQRKAAKRAAAAHVAAAAAPIDSPVVDQPSHRKKNKRRPEDITSDPGNAAANGLSSVEKQPKKKKQKAAHKPT